VSWLVQLGVAASVGLRSVPQRWGSALVIVTGTTCVVAVLLSMLAVNAGMTRFAAMGADPSRAVVHPKGVDSDWGSDALTRGNVDTISDAPGILRRSGKPVVDAESMISLIAPAGFLSGSLELRMLGAAGVLLHPDFHLIAGRLFRPGLHEVVMGAAAARHFGFHLGDRVAMPGGPWPIVGEFASGGDFLEGALVGDADTVLAVARLNGYGSVTVQLVSANAYPSFAAWVEHNPTLAVHVDRQPDFYLRIGGQALQLFTQIAYAIGGIMGLGAVFGTLRIAYAGIRARTREMGTLRALGFGAGAVAGSVLVEAVVLSTLGAAIGAGIAWLLCGVPEIYSRADYPLVVSPRLVALGLTWGAAIALLGGLLPALRAARLPPAVALRAA
jgi:putative ABC transport system permease protein